MSDGEKDCLTPVKAKRSGQVSRISLVSFALAMSCNAYIFSSLQIVFDSPLLRLSVDLFRVLGLLVVLLIFLQHIKINLLSMLLTLLAMTALLLYKDVFFAQMMVGLLLAWLLFNAGFKAVVGRTLETSLLLLCIIIAGVKLGYIESKVGFNPLALSTTAFVVEKKEYWGFWQPNIISSLISGCLITAFYLERRRLYWLAMVAYLIVLTGTFSRTFLIVPVVTLIYMGIERVGLSKSLPVLMGLLLGAFTSCLLSLLFVFPKTLKVITGEGVYQNLDNILSYRLGISERLMDNLTLFQLVTGFHNGKKEVDSFFINFALSQGALSYLLLVSFLCYVSLRAFKQKMPRELIVLVLFLLVANFEKISGISSLFYLTACCCLFSVLGRRFQEYQCARS